MTSDGTTSGNGHDPVDVGAHVLGLLDDDEARAVELHLNGCAPCRREWEELREMSDLMADLPPEAFLEGPPDGDLVLARTLRQVRAETRARRRRRIGGAAAAAAVVVAAVLGGGVLVGRATAPSTVTAAGTFTVDGTGPHGATMTAAVSPAAGWVRVAATVKGVPQGEHCRLWVVRKNGTREIAGTWVVGAAGEKNGMTLDGSADVAPADIAAVTVENTAGEPYVTARI